MSGFARQHVENNVDNPFLLFPRNYTKDNDFTVKTMKKLALRLYDAYTYIFDSNRNPLRHIPDPPSRLFIMIILATMWSGAFAIYLGSIFYFGISVAAHIVLLLMLFFTVAVFYDAEKNGSSWLLQLRKQQHH